MFGVIQTTLNEVELPTTAALDPALVKLQIKSHSERDSLLIDDWIAAAEMHFREQTGRPVMIGTYEYWLDEFPAQRVIELPLPPLQSVVSVQYKNTDGELVDFTDGGSPAANLWTAKIPTGTYAPRGSIELNYGASWPTTRCEPGAVRIQFTAGFASDPANVPALVKAALRYIVADFDRFRMNTYVPITGSPPVAIPFGVEAILRAFKYSALQTIVPRRCL